MERVAAFEARGYAIEPAVLTDAECETLDAAVDAVDLKGAGTREFLNFDWAQRLARQLRESVRPFGTAWRQPYRNSVHLFRQSSVPQLASRSASGSQYSRRRASRRCSLQGVV